MHWILSTKEGMVEGMLRKLVVFGISVFCLLSSVLVSAAENDVQRAREFISGIGCESLARIESSDAELTQREFSGYLALTGRRRK